MRYKSLPPRMRMLVLLFLALGALYAKAAERPNILFFFTDDESWLERSAYGWSALPTPAFDRVARQGVLFTNAFTSAPSCAPSRASILTGRNFWELKQGAFIQAYLPSEFPIFTKLLKESGYHVGNTAKVWGPGVVNEDSHDVFSGTAYNSARVSHPTPEMSPYDYAANFETFLQDRKPEQPFFFWAGINEPHGPWGKENYFLLEKECGMTLDQIPLPPYLEDNEANRIARANILYEIVYADRQLGRMLQHLESVGELENTLVVVTSDNGTPVSAGGRDRGKSSPYDFGVHEPMAVMWPSRVSPGRTVTDFVNFRDFAPTFLELAGIAPPRGMSGKSLSGILFSKKSGRIERSRSWMMTGLEWHGEFDPETKSSRSLRNDRYSYIVRYSNVDAQMHPLSRDALMKPYQVEFYDLVNDPWEQKNLIDDPKYVGEIKKLARQMKAYGLKTGDPRVTGDLEIFVKSREYVQARKRTGYGKTMDLPFE